MTTYPRRNQSAEGARKHGAPADGRRHRVQLHPSNGDGTIVQVVACPHDSADGQNRIDALLRDLLDTDGVVTVTVAHTGPEALHEGPHVVTPATGTGNKATTTAEHAHVIPSGHALRHALQAFLRSPGDADREEDRSSRDDAVVETIERLEGERAGLLERLDAVSAEQERSRKRLRAAGRALRATTEGFERRIEQLNQIIVGLENRSDSDVRALKELASGRGEQVRQLTSELILAEQTERQRIAEILHDELQQLLYAFMLRIQMVTPGLAAEKVEAIKRATALIARAIDVTRNLTQELSSAVQAGDDVTSMINWLAHRMEELHAMKVDVAVPGPVTLPPGVRALLYQLVRELLFNVVKHAGTNRARVRVEQAEAQVVIIVEDDGVGFDVGTAEPMPTRRGGFGLRTARQRLMLLGGSLHRESTPGKGTRIAVFVPIEVHPDGTG